jgi:F-type H+-transporting ATPase subunit b
METEILIAPVIYKLLMVWLSTGILFLIFKRYFWVKMTNYLETRRTHITKTVQETTQAKEEALVQQELANQALYNARKEAREIIDNSKSEAIHVKEQIIGNASHEANAKLESAMEEITRQRVKAMEEVRKEVVDIALGAAKEVVKGNIDEKKSVKLVDDFVKELKA